MDVDAKCHHSGVLASGLTALIHMPMGTATTGQLTANPAAGALTSMTGTNTGITLGAQATFSGATPITLLNAAASSDDIWRGYVTGVSLSQYFLAAQAPGSYTLPMTQTVAAI